MTTGPTIRKASFGDGTGWVIAGGELLARGGSQLLGVALALLLISFVGIVPMVGPLLLMLVSPAVTAGLLGVFRRVDAGEAVSAGRVFDGLADARSRPRLLVLGGVFLVGSAASLAVLFAWLSPQMDLQALAELLADPAVMNNEPERVLAMFEGVNVIGGLAAAAALFLFVLVALYFATPLVFFWNWPVLAALLWSLRAVLVNWAAFIGLALVMIAVVLAIAVVYGLVSAVLGLAFGAAAAVVLQLVSMVMSLFMQLLVAAAQWRAFVRVFPSGTDDDTSDEPRPES
jgi:hypothetical protein